MLLDAAETVLGIFAFEETKGQEVVDGIKEK